jgi:hypothetical protein
MNASLPTPSRPLVGAQEAIIALFGGLLQCEHGEPTEDQRASHARGKPAASAEEPRSAAPMVGKCRIEARSGPVAASSLAISSSSFWSHALRRSCLPKPPFAAVDEAYSLAAMAAERPVLDEPKAIGPTRTFRASKQRPGPAVPEPDVRQADQFPPVANWDDRVSARRAAPCPSRAAVGFSRTRTHRESGAHQRLLGVWAWCRSYPAPVPSPKRAAFSAQPRGPLVKGLRVLAHP